jgi:hypothetical protein
VKYKATIKDCPYPKGKCYTSNSRYLEFRESCGVVKQKNTEGLMGDLRLEKVKVVFENVR